MVKITKVTHLQTQPVNIDEKPITQKADHGLQGRKVISINASNITSRNLKVGHHDSFLVTCFKLAFFLLLSPILVPLWLLKVCFEGPHYRSRRPSYSSFHSRPTAFEMPRPSAPIIPMARQPQSRSIFSGSSSVASSFRSGSQHVRLGGGRVAAGGSHTLAMNGRSLFG